MRKTLEGGFSRRTIVLILVLVLFKVCISSADDTALFERGSDLLQEQKYSEALTAFETFVKERPEHRLIPAAVWTMANIYMTINKEYEKAADLFQKIVDEYEDTDWEIFGYDRLGRCFEEQEKWDKAADTYQTGTKRLQTFIEEPEAPTRIRGLKQKALLCYQNLSDYESIINMYQETLVENPAAPTAPEDQFNLAQTYLTMENPKESAEHFALVVDRYPASTFAQRIQSEQSDLLTSELNYDWTPFTTFQSAVELSRTGQYEESLSKLDEIIDTRPNTGMAYGAIIQKHLIEYRKTGDAAGLLEKLAAGQDKYPYGPGGIPLDRWNYFLRLIVDAQETIKTNPDDAGLYVRMSQGYYQTGAFQPGIEALKKSIAMAPNSPNACNMLGYCYLGAQEYDEAVSAFQKLIDIDPDNPNSYDSMAEGCYLKGDTTMAIQFYQKSLATDSSFTHPYYMLGQIYHELGQKEKAVEHLEKYLALDPDGFQSQNARRRLEQLKPRSSENREQ